MSAMRILFCSIAWSYCVVSAMAPSRAVADAFRILHAFDNVSGAAIPFGSLTKVGNHLYGSTAYSSVGQDGSTAGGGALFTIGLDGAGFQIVKQFSPDAPAEGYQPFQGLTPVGDRLIGTTMQGGQGTLYSIGTDGSGFQVLHQFGQGTDGKWLYAAPIAVGTKLYGMTGFGGTGTGGGDLAVLKAGVIYSYDLETSSYTLERSLSSPGSNPFGTLTQVGEWLYGMVSDHRNLAQHGAVFRYRPSDGNYEVVHSFAGGAAGGYPYDSLTWDGGHYLYGTTLGYYPWHPLGPTDIAALADEGVVFRLDIDKPPSDPAYYQVLHDFSAATGDGAKPNSSMLIAPDGWLYGIAHGSVGLGGTVNGVQYGTEFGTLYRLRPDGSDFAVLHTFDSLIDGLTPMRGLVWDDETIYGTTAQGGYNATQITDPYKSPGNGTIWSFSVKAVPEPSASVCFAGLVSILALRWAHRRQLAR